MTAQVITFNSQLYKNGNDYTAIQIGSSAQSETNSVAIGASAKATSSNSIAIGNGAEAKVANKVVIGNNSISSLSVGKSSLTIGEDGAITFASIPAISSSFLPEHFTGNQQIVSKAYVDSSLSSVTDNLVNTYAPKGDYVERPEIFYTREDGSTNVKIGKQSTAPGQYALAIGFNAFTTTNCVAVGDGAAAYAKSTTVGYDSQAGQGTNNVVIGAENRILSDTTEFPNETIVIGSGCNIKGSNSIIIGKGINLNTDNAIQIGTSHTDLRIGNVQAKISEDSILFNKIPRIDTGIETTSFTLDNQLISKEYVDATLQTVSDNVTNNYALKGDYVEKSQVFNGDNIQIGSSSSTNTNATAIGANAVAGNSSVVFGTSTNTDANSTAIGFGADTSGGTDNIGIGTGCKILPTNPVDLDSRSNNILIGNSSQIEGTNSIVIGQGITLPKDNTIQIGNGTQPEIQLGPLTIKVESTKITFIVGGQLYIMQLQAPPSTGGNDVGFEFVY
jgi:acetyltransferase-like isoleucine patch superfamily enzyme